MRHCGQEQRRALLAEELSEDVVDFRHGIVDPSSGRGRCTQVELAFLDIADAWSEAETEQVAQTNT